MRYKTSQSQEIVEKLHGQCLDIDSYQVDVATAGNDDDDDDEWYFQTIDIIKGVWLNFLYT